MDRSAIGQRLKLARQETGLSIRAAADVLSRVQAISHGTLANYERGRTTPPMEFLATAARCYRVELNWLLSPSSSFANLRYRRLKSKVTAKQREAFEARSQMWLLGYRNLESYLNKPLRNHLDTRSLHSLPPKEAAESLRRALDIAPTAPLPRVIDVIRRCGIRVIELEVDQGIDGVAGVLDDEPVIVLNSGVSNDRYRLDAAHELGHHVLGHCTTRSSLPDKAADEEAYEFGFFLLMPEQVLRLALKQFSMLRLLEFKLRYGVSLASMIYRGNRSGLIPDSATKKVWVEFAKRGYKRREPGDVPPDRPTRFEQLIEHALSKGLDYSDLTKLTGLRQAEIKARYEAILGGFGVALDNESCNPADSPRLRLVR